MRSIVYLLLCVPIYAIAQNNSHQQRPEWKAFYDKQATFRTRGTQALTAEYASEKTESCPNARNGVEMGECLKREVSTTQRNYEAYARAIGGLLRLSAPGEASATTSIQTPDMGKEFDLAELAWSKYRDAQCRAVADQYFGGDMAGGAYLSCKQEIARRHMHELESLYGDLWH
jgi:uncharacterized protein YecT (DUF1311 family)